MSYSHPIQAPISNNYHLGSPQKVKGRKGIFQRTRDASERLRLRNSQRSLLDDVPATAPSADPQEMHHIIKFKKNTEPTTYKQDSAMKKARRAIKKRIHKKRFDNEKLNTSNNESGKNNTVLGGVMMQNNTENKSMSYATDSHGIEASIKLTKSETFLNKMKEVSEVSVSKLKSASDAALTRGRSLERRVSAASVTLRRSLSMSRKRSQSNRGRSRGRDCTSVTSNKSNTMLERVKSFRRDRSFSVRSVRSTRSNFSVRSTRSRNIGGFFNKLFRRKPQYDPPTGTRILFVKEDTTPVTAPSTPEDAPPSGFFMCNAFDLFCRPEVIEDNDKSVRYDDDPRYFGVEASERVLGQN